MKASKIKKIRKTIGSLQKYKIRETASLFGDFFGCNRIGLVMNDTTISASTPVRAIQIYMKQYRRENNKKNNYERLEYEETTENWARLMVTDEKGFMHFFK